MRSRCPCAAGQFWAGRGLWLWGLQTRGECWWALLLSIDPGSCGRAAQTLGSLHRVARHSWPAVSKDGNAGTGLNSVWL